MYRPHPLPLPWANYSWARKADRLCLPGGGIRGTRIGKIFVSETEIGRGSVGRVFEGFYNDSTPVAVKRFRKGRLIPLAFFTPELIHPNIVRYWGMDGNENFQYIAVESCTCSLYDLIRARSSFDFYDRPDDSVRYKRKLRYLSDTMRGVSLWIKEGRPSLLLLKLMREVLSGLGHLHDLELLHRDLKPQNIMIAGDPLITGEPLVAKLSDMGSDFRSGTSGAWQAPEVLRRLRGCENPAADMFSFGCVLFFCVTGGQHPFGNINPQLNIVKNNMDLSSVAFRPEAHDLIWQLLDPNPILRPKASEVLQHPFFTNSETRPSFFSDARDRAVRMPHSTDASKPAKVIRRFPALLMEAVSRVYKKDVFRKYMKYF